MSMAQEKSSPEGFDPGPLADVSWHKDGFRATLVMARELGHAPEAIWPLLTLPEHLKLWSPFEPDRALDTVGPVTLKMVDGSEVVEQSAQVLQVVDNRVLDLEWNKDLLRWDLTPTEQGTQISLHHRVENPEWVARVAAGWHLCLLNADRILRDEEPYDLIGGKAMEYGWQELFEAYQAELDSAGKDNLLDEVMRP